jgi:glutaredoxin-like protein NrdH
MVTRNGGDSMASKPETESTAIILYALQTCGHCKDVKELLRQHRIRFETVYVDLLVGDERNETMRHLKRINPAVSFPTLQVGAKTIVGFKKTEIEAALDACENHL